MSERRESSWPFRSAAGREAMRVAYDEGLRPLGPTRQDRDVLTPFGRTRVVSYGPVGAPATPSDQAPPLLLIHGASASAATLRPEIEHYAAAGFRVHAPDLPGHAGLSEPRAIPPGDPGLGRWLVAVLDGLSLERTAVIGYSLGGLVALRAAQVAPARLERAVIAVPAGLSSPTVARALPMIYQLARFKLGGGRAALEAMARGLVAPGATPEPHVFAHTVLAIEHLLPERQPARPLPPEELRRIEVPFLVCPGTHDPLFDCRRSLEAARALPRATRWPIEGCGHLFDADSLARFRARSLEYLRQIP